MIKVVSAFCLFISMVGVGMMARLNGTIAFLAILVWVTNTYFHAFILYKQCMKKPIRRTRK